MTWDAALDDIGTRIRTAILEGRRDEVMYHVGWPGEDGYANRVLQAWGIDGHNSHTNVCSSSARLGHFLWTAADRPSPDTPTRGRPCCCPRTSRPVTTSTPTRSASSKHGRTAHADHHGPEVSNTSAKADIWLPAYPGTESALLLAIARILLVENLYDREFVRRWLNWQAYLRAERPDLPETFESFVLALQDLRGHSRRSSPQSRPAFRRSGSSRRRVGSRRPGIDSRPTAGGPRPPAICGAGRSPDACTFWSC